MSSREMHRHHLGQRVDIKAVFSRAVAQGSRNGDRKLFEHRIQNCETRHKLGMGSVAVVDLADRRLINRGAQVNLENFGMAVMLPASCRLAWSQTDSPRPDQLPASRTAFDFARDFGRT